MNQENPFGRDPRKESTEQAAKDFVNKFNKYVIDQFASRDHFPANCNTVSGLMEFADLEDELETLEAEGKIDENDHGALLRQMEEVGKLTHSEMVQKGEQAKLKV